MEFPFFSLSKKPNFDKKIYDDGKVRIELMPSEYGHATIWDKDIIIYACSLLNEKIERGEEPSRTVKFAAYDFLRTTGRGTGKHDYELFLSSLDRLAFSKIKTKLQSDMTDRRGFSWFEYHVVEKTIRDDHVIMGGVELILCNWLYRSVAKERRILSINPEYFCLKSGIAKRLYEISRKHCGHQKQFVIGIDRLQEKIGSESAKSHFIRLLKKIAEKSTMPDYDINVDGKNVIIKSRNPMVTSSKNETTKPQLPVITINTFQIAKQRYPKYDIDHLERVWRDYTLASKTELRDPDSAFLMFCKTHVERNPT